MLIANRGIGGRISCIGQRPPYSKLNVKVQSILRPEFLSFLVARYVPLEWYPGY